jgi:hypothetical protein
MGCWAGGRRMACVRQLFLHFHHEEKTRATGGHGDVPCRGIRNSLGLELDRATKSKAGGSSWTALSV